MGTDLGNAIDVVQTNSYYPFGLTMLQNNGNTSDTYKKNKYLYNGKEIQDDNLNSKFFGMLDYGARFYDPQIGRFSTQDAFAEKYKRWSPYSYCQDNPLKFIDINGDSAWYVNEKTGNLYYNKDINTETTEVKGDTYTKIGENDMFGQEAVAWCDEMVFPDDGTLAEKYAESYGYKQETKESEVYTKDRIQAVLEPNQSLIMTIPMEEKETPTKVTYVGKNKLVSDVKDVYNYSKQTVEKGLDALYDEKWSTRTYTYGIVSRKDSHFKDNTGNFIKDVAPWEREGEFISKILKRK